MATTVRNEERKAALLTDERVWKKVAAKSFAVLGYVTPRGEPRASGVVYLSFGRGGAVMSRTNWSKAVLSRSSVLHRRRQSLAMSSSRSSSGR